MKKTTNNNRSKEKKTTNDCWDDDYFCVFSFKRVPINKAVLTHYARELVKWVDDKGSTPFKTSDWYLSKGISQVTYNRWILKSEDLSHANDYAKERIGNHRELQSALKDGMYDGGMIRPTLGHYCPIWKQEQERTAALKSAAEQEGSGKIVVEMHAFGSSDLVPVKKAKK